MSVDVNVKCIENKKELKRTLKRIIARQMPGADFNAVRNDVYLLFSRLQDRSNVI